MNAVLIQVDTPPTLMPVTATRSLSKCCICNCALAAWMEQRLQKAGFALTTETDGRGLFFCQRSDAWFSETMLNEVLQQTESLLIYGKDQQLLGWITSEQGMPRTERILTADVDSFSLRFPWDLLRLNEELVGAITEDKIRGDIAGNVTVDGYLVLGSGSRLLPGVYIEGNVMIGRNCKIGPNCYIRGNTSIGDHCHVGQAVEIKNSLIMNNVGMGHLSYCGDSIVGVGANFGAGTITANYRHDGRNHRSMIEGVLLDTGRRKFGAVIGDDVHTGIHTSIYPGRKIWPHQSTRPGTVLQHDLR